MSKKKKKKNIDNHALRDSVIHLHVTEKDVILSDFWAGLFTKLKLLQDTVLFRILALFFIIIIFLLSILVINYFYLENNALWRSSVHDIQVGGLEESDIDIKLDDLFSRYLNRKITFSVNGNFYALPARDVGLIFDKESTLIDIMQAGHLGNFKRDFLDRTLSIIQQKNSSIYVSLDDNILRKNLTKTIPEFEMVPIDAEINLMNNAFIVTSAKKGVTTDYSLIAKTIINNADRLTLPNIKIEMVSDYSQITNEDVYEAKAVAEEMRYKSYSLLITSLDKEFELDLNKNLSLIRFSKIFNPINEQFEIFIDLDPFKLKQFLIDNISSVIDVERTDIVLDITEDLEITADGFLNDGYKLSLNESVEAIRDVFGSDNFEVELLVDIDKGKIVQPDGIDTGIHELVAYGESDFKGSPYNRRVNIDVAMKKFQNIVLMPGDILSFNDLLGPVNGATGYKKELVIKEGGKLTIAEYGGGVCQVSTTLFRAALYGGFEILDRRSHSYKVVYYNPSGLDATVYPPSVNFKFKNDYDSPILIQNILDQDTSIAIFKMYGTKDGRTVDLQGPNNYAYKKKPNTVTEYVPSKPVGWEKRSRGHNGFNTYWIRNMIMPDGSEKQDYYYSYYKALPDKIQLGGSAPVVD